MTHGQLAAISIGVILGATAALSLASLTQGRLARPSVPGLALALGTGWLLGVVVAAMLAEG